MNSTDHQDLNLNLNDASCRQLKIMIQKLIKKSKLLIQNLQSTMKQLQYVSNQKQYWKSTYFNFKETCEHYIQSQGIAPFQYLINLQTQLKSIKIQNHTIYGKLNQKVSQKIDLYKRKNQFKNKALSLTQNRQQFEEHSTSINKISPSNSFKQKHCYSKRKHQIGPKKIQLFKSKNSNIIKY